MSIMTLEALVELLGGDRELVSALMEQGIIARNRRDFGPEEVETILVSQTLVRELEVNWAGVDVILRMRRQLLMTRLRLAELASRDED